MYKQCQVLMVNIQMICVVDPDPTCHFNAVDPNPTQVFHILENQIFFS
jgi:hypothetical protein